MKGVEFVLNKFLFEKAFWPLIITIIIVLITIVITIILVRKEIKRSK